VNAAAIARLSEIPYYNNAVATHRARAEAARMLIKRVVGDALSTPAVIALKQLVRDAHPHVRINAVRSLSTFGSSVRADVIAATNDRDPNVRIAASQVVGGVLDTTLAGWTGIWGRDTSYMYRTSLAASAGHAARMPRSPEAAVTGIPPTRTRGRRPGSGGARGRR
jgi:hypothetical protein